MTPGRNSLEAILLECGIQLNPSALDDLWTYHQMLREANTRLNLTRIHQFDNMVLKHYVDSLIVLRFEDLPSPLVDMGSGPGLPGIPLAIACPDVQMVLAEPRGARAEFLQEVVDRLGLRHVIVYTGKVNSKFPFKVDGVITRAVASITETLDRVATTLNPGGKMLFMKGPDCQDEIVEARRTHEGLFKLSQTHPYMLPGSTHDRRLVVYERLNTPAPIYGEEDLVRPYDGPRRDVASETNATVKLARELLTGRGIRKHSQAIFSGPRAIAEVLDRFPERVAAWITNLAGDPPPSEAGTGLVWYRFADSLFKEIDTAGTKAPLLIVNVPAFETWSPEMDWPEGCTLFVPFQDPENVGAVLRSSAAFGVQRVVMLREAAHPFHPKSLRAAGPAVFQVELMQGPSIKELTTLEVPLITLDTNGADLSAEPFPTHFGLVPGVEGPGLPDHLRNTMSRRITIERGVESLNAATATAIALYTWRQSHR